MSNSLSSVQKLKLGISVGKAMVAETKVSLADFISAASVALDCEVTEGNVLGACRANETTPAKVFAKPTDLLRSLQARVKELEGEVEIARELLATATSPKAGSDQWKSRYEELRAFWRAGDDQEAA